MTDKTTELELLLDRHMDPSSQRSVLDEMRAVVRSEVDVLSADTYEPGHFTVSAFVTDAQVGRLVLVHHKRVGSWLQPGGHIEPEDASLEAALWRELEEEAGLVLLEPASPDLFDVDIHTVPATERRPAHRHFDLRFHLTTTQSHLEPAPGGDPVSWVPLGDVDNWTSDASVLRATAKLVAMAERFGVDRPQRR